MPKLEFRQVDAGIVEIWRADELLGVIERTDGGIRWVMGDADPDRVSTLFWGGEAFSIEFQL